MTKEEQQSILYPGAAPLCEPMPPPEMTEAEWLEQEKAKHKKAFRIAFDELALLWPPEDTVEYWSLVVDRLGLAHHDNRDSELCKSLLIGLLDYLDKLGKERKKRYGTNNGGSTDRQPGHGQSDPADAGMDGG